MPHERFPHGSRRFPEPLGPSWPARTCHYWRTIPESVPALWFPSSSGGSQNSGNRRATAHFEGRQHDRLAPAVPGGLERSHRHGGRRIDRDLEPVEQLDRLSGAGRHAERCEDVTQYRVGVSRTSDTSAGT